MKINDTIPEFVQSNTSLTLDSIIVEPSVVFEGEGSSALASYVNIAEVGEKCAQNISGAVGALDYIPVVYEYLSIVAIIGFAIEMFRNCSKDITRIFKTIESAYLAKRYLENTSLALSQLYIRINLIFIISSSFLMFRIMPTEVFGQYAFLNDYRIPIFIAIVVLLLLLNLLLLKLVEFCSNIRLDVLRQVTSLSNAHMLFYIIVVLLAIIISYVYPNDNFLASKIVVLSGGTAIYVYSFFVIAKHFHYKNVSFLQYILYFCTVKAVGILFFGYCIRVIFG